MGLNTGVFSGPSGSLRLFTLILGALVVGLAQDCRLVGEDYEDFFFWTAVILLIVSAILAVVSFLGITGDAVFVKKGDSGFHLIGGVIFLVAAVLMLISVFDKGKFHSTGTYVERIAAGAIGLINALIYCSLGWNMWRG